MSRLWLVGIVAAALALVAVPILIAAEGEDAAGERPRQRRPGERGEGAGNRPSRPRVEVSEQDQAKMQKQIQAVQNAIDALQKKAVEVLGDERAARGFIMQTIFTRLRPQGGREGGERGKREGDRKRPKGENAR